MVEITKAEKIITKTTFEHKERTKIIIVPVVFDRLV